MKRRIMTLLLVFTMLAGLLPMGALANSEPSAQPPAGLEEESPAPETPLSPDHKKRTVTRMSPV